MSRICAFLAIIACALCLTVLPQPVLAVQPDEMLSDPALETRARKISAGLRCLVCQNQSIDDSDAPLAGDLRRLVRERLKANDTDEQVVQYVVARYGDFVLLKPPFNGSTLILWLSPLVIFAGGLWLARRVSVGQVRSEASAVLSAQEQARLKELLAGKGEGREA